MPIRRPLAASALAASAVAAVLLTGTIVGLPHGASEAAETPSIRFTAAGDYSTSSAARDVLSRIGEIDPDLHLTLGDLSYGAPGEEEAWCDLVKDRVDDDLPFQLLAGNHESDGRNGFIDNFAACLPNRLPGLVGTYAREYYVDVPAEDPLVRYVMVSPGITFPDGTWRYDEGGPRYEWTEDAIDGARDADIPWVVVSMHNPCLSMGRYECGAGEDLANLFLDKRVDLVLGGHEHVYQRSHQLATSADCPEIEAGTLDRDCIVDDDASMEKGEGTVFATIGTGGTSLRDVYPGDTEAPYFAASSGANANPTFGVLDVDVSATGLTARFDRALGGTFADEFTIGAPATDSPTPPDPAPPAPPARSTLAADDFDRDLSTGWGTADTGGPWLLTSSSSRYYVNDGAARVVVQPGKGPNAYLTEVSSSSTLLRTSVGTAEPVSGRGIYLYLTARHVEGAGAYSVKVNIADDGGVRIQPVRLDRSGGLAEELRPATAVPGLTYTEGDRLIVEVEVSDTSPTTVRTKAWAAGEPEPEGWLQSATDATRDLQGEGGIALNAYLSMRADGPVEVFFDELTAVAG